MLLEKLRPNDEVALIAPASKATPEDLNKTIKLLESWKLKVHCAPNIFGDDLLCANDDETRFNLLKEALSYKAIFCVRGGYGSMRLIPYLEKLPKQNPKIFVGMSDCTALHMFLHKHWHWPTIHAGISPNKFAKSSLDLLKNLLFHENMPLKYSLKPINQHILNETIIKSLTTGGNLTLVQSSIGTNWQINTDNKIVFLEEINECPYKIDRMLTHLWQAGIFYKARALILGDFIHKNNDEDKLMNEILARFASLCHFPVLRIDGIGHGKINNPLPLNTELTLNLGYDNSLMYTLK